MYNIEPMRGMWLYVGHLWGAVPGRIRKHRYTRHQTRQYSLEAAIGVLSRGMGSYFAQRERVKRLRNQDTQKSGHA